MKLKLSRKAFTLVLAVLLGAAMTPCVLQAQSQSSTTTSASTSKASKRKAKKAAKEKAAAEKKAGEQSSAAATSTKAEAAHTSTAARSNVRHEVATNQSATPPQPGMVWVNTSTKVYHKSGSRWAGHTKSGKWMSEADAQKAGYKAAKN